MMFAATSAVLSPTEVAAQRGPHAKTDTDAAVVGWWILGAAATAYCANQIRDFVAGWSGISRARTVQTGDQGLTVRQAVEYQTKENAAHDLAAMAARIAAVEENVAAFRAEVASLRADVIASERRLMAADEARAASIHTRINEILIAVGRLQGTVDKTPS